MQDKKQLPHRPYAQLLRTSQSMGVIKWVDQGKFQNFKLAYHPFQSSRHYYQHVERLHEAWHRVLLRVALDQQFLINLFTPIAGNDEVLNGVLEIVKKRNENSLLDGVCLDRIDYYNDESGQPKLTQYNLQCVGMMSHMERFQDAKRLLENNDKDYVPSPSVHNFAFAVQQITKIKKAEGILLFVIYAELEADANYIDQGRIEIQYRKSGFKVIRTNLKQMSKALTLKQNGDLYFEEQKVAVVYYRGVYKANHYKFGQGYDVASSWKAREKVALSNAISIPPIEFELVNQKRVQTELAKPEVLRRYASQEQAELLTKTRVGEWEFDSITQEELSALTVKVEINPDLFLLKPNKEGGGNNVFGADIVQKLKGDRQQLRSYILMQKINTKPVQNVIIDGHKHYTEECEYQISRYGTLTWANGEVVRNQADGFLIRAKPPTANEGGIMAGIGAIVTWKIVE